MLPQRGTSVSIVSFVRGIVKTWECELGELGRGSRGWGVSHSEVVQDPAWGGVASPLLRVGMGSSTLLGRGWLWTGHSDPCSSLSSLRAL